MKTREELLEALQSTYEAAMANEQPAAAVAAIREMVQILGVRIERVETTVTVETMTDDELMAVARRSRPVH
ncbi:hypothetical protein [Terrihabitans rhizophilus]|uniref:Uncharacterized protein n=1 Tax=Terrihabitans rhizophilus TaxID=3092662 RepID=A0ABU4RQS2_9HYPH|nr:hypothetical protein [Terrihabitans sp. PJ23]MDX6807167.1 hypothetical protein [Terrihabitans sp. PJ23]